MREFSKHGNAIFVRIDILYIMKYLCRSYGKEGVLSLNIVLIIRHYYGYIRLENERSIYSYA